MDAPPKQKLFNIETKTILFLASVIVFSRSAKSFKPFAPSKTFKPELDIIITKFFFKSLHLLIIFIRNFDSSTPIEPFFFLVDLYKKKLTSINFPKIKSLFNFDKTSYLYSLYKLSIIPIIDYVF